MIYTSKEFSPNFIVKNNKEFKVKSNEKIKEKAHTFLEFSKV